MISAEANRQLVESGPGTLMGGLFQGPGGPDEDVKKTLALKDLRVGEDDGRAKTLLYTLFASGISVAVGVGLVNLFKPGEGIDPSVRANLEGAFASQSQKAIESAAEG